MNKIIISQKNNKKINWDIPQYVILKDEILKDKNPIIVLIIGDNKLKPYAFKGFALPCESFPNGDYSENWEKDDFKLFEGEATLLISNE